jgi:hypothetical protein
MSPLKEESFLWLVAEVRELKHEMDSMYKWWLKDGGEM